MLSGFYPFQSNNLPGELSRIHKQPLFNIADDVVGIMLPYPHGFDSDPDLLQHIYDREFLHIFNMGTSTHATIQGVARCVKYETGLLPPKKRITFALETSIA